MAQTMKLGTAHTCNFNDEGRQKVVYHSTCVIKWNDEQVVLNSGGWMTNTTKSRMNQASNQFGPGISVFQRNFNWFVRLQDGKDVPFVDGMTIQRS